MLTSQQQQWLQAYQQRQAALLQQNHANFLASQPWRQPGYSRFQNPLMAPAQIQGVPGVGPETETDPQAAMMPYLMGMMGGGQGAQGGGGMDPMLMHMLMSGATGFSG